MQAVDRNMHSLFHELFEVRDYLAHYKAREDELRAQVNAILYTLPNKSYASLIGVAKIMPESFTTAYNVDIVERGIAMLLSKGLVVEAQLFSAGREERKRNAYPLIRKPTSKKEAPDA